jgi:glycosyltransferase involved in cell wall biosynthesis
MRIGINAHLVAFNKSYRQAGVSKYTELLINNLVNLDQTDQFFIYIGNQPRPQNFANATNFRVRASRLPTIKPPVRIAWEQSLAPALLLRDRLNLLHCPVNVVPLAAPSKTVVTIHDLGFMRYPERYRAAKRRYLTAATSLSARRAAHIITDAESGRQEIIELLKVRPEKVTAVPLGVDARFRPLPPEEIEQFRQEKKLPARFVLYLGTLEPRKNIPLLLRGFARLRRENPAAVEGVELVLGGAKGWLYDEIFRLVQQLGLEQTTHFPGYVSEEELPLWYNSAECFVYPSIYEGFGLPPLEAMASGCPVITSNTSSLPEVVGKAGITVGPEDEAGLATALAQLLTDPAERVLRREQGRAQAQKFTWEETARRTLEIYRRIAG